GRIDRAHARRAEAVRDELDAKAGSEGEGRRLCRRGYRYAERPEHRDDEADGGPDPLTALAASPSMPPRDASHGPHTRARGSVIHADRWVVRLRVVVGVRFVKAVGSKFTRACL